MGDYIFLTAEGSTYQPNSSSFEPDIDNLQVIGFAQGESAKEASTKLLETNAYLSETSFEEIFAVELADQRREYFSLSDLIKAHD